MATQGSENRALCPRDAADVADILRGRSHPVELVGAGSKRAIGCPLDADVLDLSALAGIVRYEPAELVLTARAATPLDVIDRELAAHGQRLAFEPPSFGALVVPETQAVRSGAETDADFAAGHVVAPAARRETTDGGRMKQTIGGVLSANLSGSRRVSAGAARDHFLGFEAVTGSGEPFKAGGKVVKNVTGYDLPKLLAGSWGTLAALTEVTLRVAPAPETETTLVIWSGTVEDAVASMTRSLSSAYDVSAAAFDPPHRTALRIEGFEASVAARVRGVVAALGNPHVELLDAEASQSYWLRVGCAAAIGAWPLVWRISVPPSEAPRVLAAIAPEKYLLDWGGGLIWAAYAKLDVERVRHGIGTGHAMLWKAPHSVRAAVPFFQPQPPAVAAIAARVKAALDPLNRLNPDRIGFASHYSA